MIPQTRYTRGMLGPWYTCTMERAGLEYNWFESRLPCWFLSVGLVDVYFCVRNNLLLLLLLLCLKY